MPESDRIQYAPDYAKAFGIILVVIGHVLRGLISAGIVPRIAFWSAIDHMIYLFHMPLFFYISGLFCETSLKRYGYGRLIAKNSVSLLLPLIIWSYLQFTLQYMAGGAANLQLGLKDVLLAPFPPREQFWFLGTLFIVICLAAALLIFSKSRGLLMAIIVLVFAIPVLDSGAYQRLLHSPSHTLFILRQMILNLPYFLVGIIVNIEKIEKIRFGALGCICIFILCLCAYQMVPEPAELVRVFTSIGCILCVYKFMSNRDHTQAGRHERGLSKFAAFVGMNSMIIYLAHVIFAASYRALLVKLGVLSESAHLAGGVLFALAGPLALVPLGMKWAEFTPVLAKIVLPVRYRRAAH